MDDAEVDLEADICTSCGVAEVDEIKLMKCDVCDLLDIAAMHVSRSMGYSTKQCAKIGRPNHVMRFYLGSLRAPILYIELCGMFSCRHESIRSAPCASL
eukprot:scaffold4091_cov85-Skeletonema_dohrnii-CCMP3373.AAC.4